jgi:hypothetical protein
MTEGNAKSTRVVPSTLIWFAGGTLFWLVLAGAAALIGAIMLLGEGTEANAGFHGAVLSVVGGALGSSVSALISAAERISHGWELSSGVKYPAENPKNKFVARMMPFFIIRPFLGAAVGFLAYVGIVGGFLIAVENADATQFSGEGLLFITILTGLFAKTFLEKMRAAFDTLFGKQKESGSKEKTDEEK